MEITKKPNIPQQIASVSNKNQADVTSWIKNNSFTNSKKNMVKLVVLALLAFLLPFSVVVSSATYSKYDFFKKDQVTEGDVLGAGEAVCQEDKVCGMVGLGGCVARAECLENEFACGEGADMVCCDKGECQECSPCIDGFQAEANECGEVTKSCESVDCTGGVCGEVESVCYPVKYKVTYSTKEGKCPDPEEVCPGTANKAPECSSDTATVQEYTLISGTCEGFDTKTGVCDEVVEDLEVGVVWEPMVLPKGSPLMGAKGGAGITAMTAPSISSVSPTNYSFLGGGSMTINVGNILDTSEYSSIHGGGGHTCGLRADGKVFCWGYNTSGELGNGTTQSSSVPVKVTTSVKFSQIASGTFHTCGLDGNGMAYCWGSNSNGQLGNNSTNNSSTPVLVSIPVFAPKDFGFVSITGGGNHTCAIGNNGKAYCWGSGGYGQLGNGGTSQQTTPVEVSMPSGVTFSSISAGGNHTCAKGSDNKGYCWGDNAYGKLGDGTAYQRNTPVAVLQGAMPSTSIGEIQAGRHHSCALNGYNPYCWGRNDVGQLGNGGGAGSSTPVAVSTSAFGSYGLRQKLNLGDNHTCIAATVSHLGGAVQVFCWGEGTYGQMGNGGTAHGTTPVAVSRGAIPTGVGFTDKLTTGLYHSCIVGSDNKGYCWGAGGDGRLGNGGTTDATQPVAVLPGENVNNKSYEINIGNNVLPRELDPGTTSINISPIPAHAHGNVSISIKRLEDNVSSNTVSFTYNNLPGPTISNINPSTIKQSGGETVNITGSNFLDYGPFKTLSSISAGSSHTCAIGNNGNGYCWGAGSNGRLGNGGISQQTTPVEVSMPSGVTFSSVSAGSSHTCAVGSNGKGYCWGFGGSGQLGNGGTSQQTTPVEVSMPSGVTFSSISAGGSHTCAVGSNGKGYCWGFGGSGRLGNGGTSQQTTPVEVSMPSGVTFSSISASGSHTCARDSDSNGYCWGYGGSGQLGNGGTSQQTTPVAVSMPSGVTFSSISAGYVHTCAVGNNGKGYCWGAGSNGRLGNGGISQQTTPVEVSMPSGVTFSSISAGGSHTCAVGSNGKGYCWGFGGSGRLGNGGTSQQTTPVEVSMPSGVTFSSISASGSHTCAVGNNGKGYCWGYNYYGQLGNDETTERPTPSYVLKKENPTIEFGSTLATSTTYTSTTAMSAVTPALPSYGTIMVKLTNPDGQYATRNITVTAPPTAPRNLTATAGNKQVVLNWTAPSSPGSSAITDYIVEYSTNGMAWTTFNDGVSTNTTATVTGLTNGTLYYFRVSAVNSAGTGPNSNTATATPFNARPVFSAISNNSPSGSPKIPGDSITWNATAYDPDSNQVKLVVCDSQGITGSTCNGTELCSSSLVASNPSCSHTATPPYAAGPHDAYVYVFDGEGLAASGGVHNTNSVFYINNVAPSVLSVTLNSGNAITLLESTTTSVSIKTQIESNNGCQSIGTVTAYLYRSGKGYTYCNKGADADNNFCYSEISCIRDAGECTAPYGKTARYTCTASVWYYADPTDNNTVYSSENWLATVKALGGGGTVGTAQSSTGVEMNSLIAFDVTSSLNYGDLLVSEVTDPLSKVLTTTATGNVGINQNHSGEGMGMCVDYNDQHNPCSVGTPIDLSYQKYSTLASTSYTDSTNAKTLTSTPTLVQLKIPKVTSTPTSANTWWGISIPSNILPGAYEGRNRIEAVKSAISDW